MRYLTASAKEAHAHMSPLLNFTRSPSRVERSLYTSITLLFSFLQVFHHLAMHSRYFCIIVIILQLTHHNLAVPFTSPNLYGLPLKRHADRANVPNHKHGT